MTKQALKIKNRILKASCYIAAVLWVVSVCTFDSEPFPWVSVAVCLVSMGWLGLVNYATERLKDEKAVSEYVD